MTNAGPRRDKTALNARRIQVEISEILRKNQQGVHFNEIFRLLKEREILNNNSILIQNLRALALKGLIKKSKLPGKGFGKIVYIWSGKDKGTEKDVTYVWTGKDKDAKDNQPDDISFFNWIPFVFSSTSEGNELRSVHVLKGHKEDFQRAVSVFNSIESYCKPTIDEISDAERRFLAGFMENTIKLMQIQSSILRESKTRNNSWQVFFSIVTKNFEDLFEEFATNTQNQPREKMLENSAATRRRLGEIFQAMLMKKEIDMDRIRIYEKS
jgi:DNA-binding HxlR family transcriptional regulator